VYLAVVVLAGLCVCLSANAGGGGDRDGDGKKQKKSKIVEVDLSKLPPDLAKALAKYTGKGEQKGDRDEQKGDEPKGKGKGKGKKGMGDEDGKKGKGGKTLSLTQAIKIAENVTKGSAIRAELRTEGKTPSFRIEIQDSIGRRRVDLSTSGEVLKNDARKQEKD
jgi:uncharacterized membrane protein YkoI